MPNYRTMLLPFLYTVRGQIPKLQLEHNVQQTKRKAVNKRENDRLADGQRGYQMHLGQRVTQQNAFCFREAALTFSVFITRLHLQPLNQSALWNFQVSVTTSK